MFLQKEEVEMKMLKNKKGQGLVEYALLVVLIVGIAAVALPSLNAPITAAFAAAVTAINNGVAAV